MIDTRRLGVNRDVDEMEICQSKECDQGANETENNHALPRRPPSAALRGYTHGHFSLPLLRLTTYRAKIFL